MDQILDTPARTRRSLLAAAVGGASALVLAALGRPQSARADDPNDVVKGAANTATAVTSVENTTAAEVSFAGIHSADGTGLSGSSSSGVGVAATSDTGTALTAFVDTIPVDPEDPPDNASAIIAAAGDRTDIAPRTSGTAIYGHTPGALGEAGVWGDTTDGVGIVGTSETGIGAMSLGSFVGNLVQGDIGVYSFGNVAGVVGDVTSLGVGVYGFTGDLGATEPPTGIGVLASAANTSLTALQVNGKARFSRSGRQSVPSGLSSYAKTVSGVTTSSMVFAVLQQAETGTWVRAAVPTTNKITIHFNKALPTNSVVAWFILN
jgi:hypothetical protein